MIGPENRDAAALLAAYRELDGQIAQLDTEIAGLRHKQALLIGLMRIAGLSYRSLAPLLGVSKSRVHQFTVEHGPVPGGSPHVHPVL